MQRVSTYTDGQLFHAADLDNLQDRAADVLATNGLMIGGDVVSCSDGTHILVSRIRALSSGTAANASGLVASTGSVSSIAAASMNDVATGNPLVQATWYYLYAYISGGSIAFEVDSTAPDTDLVWKSTDSSRRYICAFRTYTSSTSIWPFDMHRGRYRWRHSMMASSETSTIAGSPFVLLSSTTNGAGGDADTRPLAPPIAKRIELLMRLQGAGGGTATPTLTVVPAGDTGSTGVPVEYSLGGFLQASASDFRQQVIMVPIGLHGPVSPYASVTTSLATSNSHAGLVYATGWEE